MSIELQLAPSLVRTGAGLEFANLVDRDLGDFLAIQNREGFSYQRNEVMREGSKR